MSLAQTRPASSVGPSNHWESDVPTVCDPSECPRSELGPVSSVKDSLAAGCLVECAMNKA